MAAGTFKLDLGDQKKNVFVTQLQDRDYDEEDVTAYPIVKESADKLIETGINTLQKTLLLKKEVEVDKVHLELLSKRAEFKERMQACSERQIKVQKKQQQMKEKVSQYEKFIKENEAKRRRAIQKYQNEVKLREQRTRELEMLQEQLEDLKQREKISQTKKFEQYLLRVVDAMPENYIEMQDNMVNSLMMRHRTLNETNKDLVEGVSEKADELEKLRNHLDQLKQEHDKMKLSINSELSKMQKHQEGRVDGNKQLEESYILGKGDFREQRSELGQILMAINNIANKCTKETDIPVERIMLDEKLDRIQEYMLERIDVAQMASADGSEGDQRTKSGRSGHSWSRKKNAPKVMFAA
ncbi:coiled-coil domain-containing protein 42 homolog [Lingula anatina]|uniref:Coiled-coil domain-containing protein 42 homolog n=1 Tax=Lingula anatina TaxID=7574 RepID=A0A1S3JUS8_LINAN|nr:coiled-coil domain-containing protein 42 homolog [Lingula anatina]|eukprot:XP_013414072.1 coiled-coil domain-containing protein 42 homolog [Lingula anatina]